SWLADGSGWPAGYCRPTPGARSDRPRPERWWRGRKSGTAGRGGAKKGRRPAAGPRGGRVAWGKVGGDTQNEIIPVAEEGAVPAVIELGDHHRTTNLAAVAVGLGGRPEAAVLFVIRRAGAQIVKVAIHEEGVSHQRPA